MGGAVCNRDELRGGWGEFTVDYQAESAAPIKQFLTGKPPLAGAANVHLLQFFWSFPEHEFLWVWPC